MQKQHAVITFAIALFFVAAFSAPNAAADILLKAVGKNEISLRPKTMDSQISIRGQIAQIKTTLTMASELDIQSEADFEYTVPDNTLVTYFAYWYKGKKVVARIVTKERAAEIYRIVSNTKVKHHRRWTNADPAIVEMTDKNTFHVRIFPIEANADLKVEIHSVQLLNSDAKGSVFTFPLKAPEKNKGTFEKIHLHLQLYPGSNVTDISNNYNLPLIRSNNIQTLDLQQQNWRAPQDLEVRFTRPIKALNADLYSARAGGANGFFALTIIPSQDIPHPRLEIQGIKTWQLLPAKLAPMKAHEPVLITGRYSGNGAAKVLLHGYGKNGVLTATSKVLFSSQKAQPNPAAQFWAKLQMQHLATNPKNKSAIIQLSERFNLPSKYTSWLALPEEGRKVYEKNLANLKIDEFGPKLAKLIADGKGKSTSARHLREVINQQSRIIDENPDDVVTDYLGSYISKTINDIIHAKQQNGTDVNYVRKKQNHLRMLLSYIPTQNNERIKRQIFGISRTDYDMAVKRYVSMIRAGKKETPEAKAILGHIERLHKKLATSEYHLDDPKAAIKYRTISQIKELLGAWANEKLQPHSNEAHLEKIDNAISNLTPLGEQISKRKKAVVEKVFNDKIRSLAYKANNDKDSTPADSVQQMIAQASALGKRGDVSTEKQEAVLQKSVHIITQPLSRKYFSIKDEYAHKQKAAEIKQQLEQIASLTGVSYKDVVSDAAESWAKRQLQRNSLPSDILVEQRKEKPDYDKIMSLKNRMYEAVKILHPTYSAKERAEEVQKRLAKEKERSVAYRVAPLNRKLEMDKTLEHPDAEYERELENSRHELIKSFPPDVQNRLKKVLSAGYFHHSTLYTVRTLLLHEYKKKKPNEARVQELKDKLIELEKDDWYLSKDAAKYTRARNITNPILYGNLRAQRLELRANREKIEEKITSETDPSQIKTLKDQKAKIMAQQKKLIARMGDPLISVQASDAVSVVALMPDGQIKQLVFDVQKERWEARFDIPASAVEGQYTIQIIVVHKDGSRQMLKMGYSVDLTPPTGNAQMTVIDKDYSGQKVLRLEVQTDKNAARVSALLPWHQKVELMPSENTSNQFYALTPVPEIYGTSTFPVTFVLTDKAHNRAEITVEQTL